MNIRRAGDRAIIVELPDLAAVLSLAKRLESRDVLGVREVVPAAKTVFVSAWSPGAIKRVIGVLSDLDESEEADAGTAKTVDIEVVYDGEDLAGVAELAGCSSEAVVTAHTGQTWTAAFGGFAPGFMYLTGENADLDVPRRDTPRKKVPAGAVAIAGGFSAVYPRESPGGWQLIGRTAAAMWDSKREPPALVSPGDHVRFTAVREIATIASRPTAEEAEQSGDLVVLEPGMQALIQDSGRPGRSAVGVTASGAMDRVALRLANSLVGNPGSAAVIESLFGGLHLRAGRDAIVAVTGAAVEARVDERHVGLCEPILLRQGEELAIGAPSSGCRAYVAVRGGIDAEPELGSRSSDMLSGLGPPPLKAGSVLRIGSEPNDAVGLALPQKPPAGDIELRYIPGPRDDWFDPDSLDRLASQIWEVSTDSNRVGLRLEGTPLKRMQDGELPSEGVTRGSIQVPPNGQPVLFMADHPVTGGYPVIGTVLDSDTDLAGQVVPGSHVRFVAVSAEP